MHAVHSCRQHFVPLVTSMSDVGAVIIMTRYVRLPRAAHLSDLHLKGWTCCSWRELQWGAQMPLEAAQAAAEVLLRGNTVLKDRQTSSTIELQQ